MDLFNIASVNKKWNTTIKIFLQQPLKRKYSAAEIANIEKFPPYISLVFYSFFHEKIFSNLPIDELLTNLCLSEEEVINKFASRYRYTSRYSQHPNYIALMTLGIHPESLSTIFINEKKFPPKFVFLMRAFGFLSYDQLDEIEEALTNHNGFLALYEQLFTLEQIPRLPVRELVTDSAMRALRKKPNIKK